MEAIWPQFVKNVATIIAHSDVNITNPNGTEYGPEDDYEEEIPPPPSLTLIRVLGRMATWSLKLQEYLWRRA